MEIKDIKINKRKERKTKSITIRTFPSTSKWLKDNDVSPTKLFNEAIKELRNKN